jgi:mercuric ion transport protein
MRDRALVTTGAIGAVLAAICCTTPLLAVVFGAIGLTGWLTRADYVVMPALLICFGLVSRFRSSQAFAATSERTSESKRTLETL